MAMKLVIGTNTEMPTGEALERLKIRAHDRADELYCMVKRMLDEATMSDDWRSMPRG